MDKWLKKLAEDYSYMADIKHKKGQTGINMVIGSEDVDINKMYKLLSSNGFAVKDIAIQDHKEPMEGDRVIVNASHIISNDVMIKTPYKLYRVASVVLPEGLIGDITHINNKTASVLFNSDIQVEAVDRSGYLDTMDYYVGEVEVPMEILNLLK